MAIVLSLINMKGGVGKSTLAVNLAWHFAGFTKWLKNVLVVDLDPQFNASQYMLGDKKYATRIVGQGSPTVWDIFEQRTRIPGKEERKEIDQSKAIVKIVQFAGGSRLDLLASRLELAWSLKQPAEKERLLAKFLDKVKINYDLVIIDCAPTESLLTTAAYLASDYVLVPVKPEYLSTIGLPLLARSLEEFRQHYDDHKIEVAGVAFNHASNYLPEEAKSKREVKAEASRLGWHVFASEVRYSRSFPKGAREGQPIFRTSNAQQTQKTRFFSFVVEVASRLGI